MGTEDNIKYELVDIQWTLYYPSFIEEDVMIVGEETPELMKEAHRHETDMEGIPMGQTIQEIRQRQQIISQFYYNWKIAHPEKRIFNHDLKEFINVRQVSIEEAKEHSAKSYNSTKAFMKIEEVLEKAKKVAEVPPKQGNKNQSRFSKLLILSHTIEEIGIIKLTVGILKSNKDKIQYGISALRADQPLVEKVPINKQSKKKASHKK